MSKVQTEISWLHGVLPEGLQAGRLCPVWPLLLAETSKFLNETCYFQAVLGLHRCNPPEVFLGQAKWMAWTCGPCGVQARLARHIHPCQLKFGPVEAQNRKAQEISSISQVTQDVKLPTNLSTFEQIAAKLQIPSHIRKPRSAHHNLLPGFASLASKMDRWKTRTS